MANAKPEMPCTSPPTAAQLRTLPDNDALMAGAMAENLVVLGVSGIPEALDGGDRKPLPTPIVAMGSDPREFLPQMQGLVGVTPVLSAAAAGVGLVTLIPDVDGIVRRVPLIGSVNGQLLPSLALEAVRIALHADKLFVRSGPYGISSIAIGRAAAFAPNLMIMDEPTSALAVAEVEAVLRLIRRLAEAGAGVILITHRLQDLFLVCDRIAVMYEGLKVAERRIGETDLEDLVGLIVGGKAERLRGGASHCRH